MSLVLAEHDNNQLIHTTLSTLTAATLLQLEVTVLVIGHQCRSVAEEAATVAGVEKVIYIDHQAYENHLAENIADVVAELSEPYSHILAPANTFGKNLMPRIAGLLELGQISDITQVIDAKTFVRPIYAGNALVTVESLDPVKLITVRTTSFEKAGKSNKSASIKEENIVYENNQTKWVERQETKSDRPELTTAKIVISGGRGLQNADNFKLLEQLAGQLGAAVGASRAAVDAGLVPNDFQVGQTGKVVAPDLYIAIGISGAIQHIAGMKDSKIVVAINKDPDAPIFSVADYGFVGDFLQILPELKQELNKLGY